MTQNALNSENTTPQVALSGIEGGASRATSPWWKLELSLSSVVSFLLLAAYSYAFYSGVSDYWFHPGWTTDDALQQSYPFHEVKTPGLFEGDITTDVMKGYLAPAHYALTYGITILTGDPIMSGHWVMLIQVLLTAGFLFAAIRSASSSVAALVAVTWLFHSRNLMQRLTGGLPRGWSAPVFAAFFYFAIKGNHRGVLVTILLGCLLNPPATLVVALTYGLLLVWRSFAARSDAARLSYRRRLVNYALLAPFFALVTLAVVHRPAHIGQMVSFQEASSMPEFSRPYGRFPFIPFNPALSEIRIVGLEAFVGRFHAPPAGFKQILPYAVIGSLVLLALIGALRRRVVIPAEVFLFGCAALTVYALSRQFAFRLYVPNRHLQIPMAMFFISAFTVGVWRALHRGAVDTLGSEGALRDTRLRWAWPSVIGLLALGLFVVQGSGTGLNGTANFNYASDKKGRVFDWLRANTPQGTMVAGHPTHLDGVQLFAARKGYVTTETTHPFYTRYYAEMKRRSEVVLRANYSRSFEEFLAIVEPEKIDYFVFKRADFYPDTLKEATFFPPLDGLVKQLTSGSVDSYTYKKLPEEVDLQRYPFMPFKDRISAVVDVKALRSYVQQTKLAARAARQFALHRKPHGRG